MRGLIVVAALALALAGCADHPPAATPMHDGPVTASPAGWVDYCGRHATDDPRCSP